MFEIGDKVIYQGADKAAYKREGTVVSIEDKDGQPQLTVELDGGETFTAPIDDWSRKFNNSARNAKLAVGDKVRVWQYPIRGQYGKVVKVGLMEYDVEVDGKVYPGIDYRRVVKMPAANACTSTNSVVRNAMAARNAAPKDLTPTTKLRLKEDFSDEYGSYRKGDVFPMYAMGGINPRFGTMMVPGRGVTLQIPWEKLEVVNAKRVARNRDLTEAEEEKLEKDFAAKINKFFSLLNEVFPKLRMLYAVANSAALILRRQPDMYDGDGADFYKVEKAVINLEKVAESIEMRL